MRKYFAELFGTMTLVILGCGAAVFNGGADSVSAVLTISFAFGMAVVAMAYSIGGISGCHINPAVTLGALLCGRISVKDAGMYIMFQIIGAIIGSAIIYFMVQGLLVTGTHTGANGWSAEISTTTAFLAEMIFTAIFVFVVLGTTADTNKQTGNFAGLAIGLSLVLIHIVCIPITGTSVNPARSIGPAIFEGGEAMSQLWLFVVAPMGGGAIAAAVWKILSYSRK